MRVASASAPRVSTGVNCPVADQFLAAKMPRAQVRSTTMGVPFLANSGYSTGLSFICRSMALRASLNFPRTARATVEEPRTAMALRFFAPSPPRAPCAPRPGAR